MSSTTELPEEVRKDMEEKGIDTGLTLRILRNFNEGRYDTVQPIRVTDIPSVDDRTILDLTGEISFSIDADTAAERITTLDGTIRLEDFAKRENGTLTFDRRGLRSVGTLLYPFVAYGVLNGGSATSYADYKKNYSFNPKLFSLLEADFDRLADISRGRAKGLTPAFLNPDGTPGPSFLLLKLRSLLIQALEYRELTGRTPESGLPFFQMTSVYTDEEVADAYSRFAADPLLSELISATGIDVTRAATGVQPLLAAYTHSEHGRPKRIFARANGKENNTLPLPGGHGQNFEVLTPVYRALRESGKRFAYLGNVDNLGFTVDPVELALLALSGRQAGFDFAFKTPVDVKGGILVVDQRQRLNCADIGPAVSREETEQAENEGKRILFNCATGLFNLEYLVPNLEYIVENLPVRFSDQDKDAGRYSQAEQVTWEIIGMLDDFYIFGIDKYDRFLAAKLLMDTLMTSGRGLDNPAYPRTAETENDPAAISGRLNRGLERKLQTVYGMRLENGRWEPRSVRELQEVIRIEKEKR